MEIVRTLRISNLLLVALLMLSCLAASARAQEPARADYFEHDFARRLFDAAVSATHQPVGTSRAAPDTGAATAHDAPSEKPANIRVKPTEMVLVVSTDPLQRCRAALRAAQRTYEIFKIVPRKVIFVGTAKECAESDEFAALAPGRPVMRSTFHAPPAGYDISSSPTWILEADIGEIVLEGKASPEEMLDQHGEMTVPAPTNG